MPVAPVGDISIHYEVADYTDPWRESETVLLYHAFARNRKVWYAWVPLLAREYRVLRFDARGAGDTTKPPPETYTVEQLADDAIGLMDHLSIERVHWIGEQSGGIVGLMAALRHRERLLSLTVCDTPFSYPAAQRKAYAGEEADTAAFIAQYGVGELCRRTLPYRIDVNKAPPGLGEWLCEQMDRMPRHIAIRHFEATGGEEFASRFYARIPDVRVPTLLLSGGATQAATERREQMELMSRMIPNSRFVVFEGYGHGIALVAPERCVEEVRTFIHQVPRP